MHETVNLKFGEKRQRKLGRSSVSPMTAFFEDGIAAVRFENSGTDIVFSPDAPRRFDSDDSFRDVTTEFGWAIGLDIEFTVANSWTIHIQGSYVDFGRSFCYLNRSGDR